MEKKIIDLVVPADIIIRYLFGDDEGKVIAKNILTAIYPQDEHKELMESFIHSGERATELIEKSIDFATIKNSFFF